MDFLKLYHVSPFKFLLVQPAGLIWTMHNLSHCNPTFNFGNYRLF